MNTDDLIRALATDSRPRPRALFAVWWAALGVSVGVAAAIFFLKLGPRADFAAVATDPRFLFKFLVAVTLAVSAFHLVRLLSRPGEEWRRAMPYMLVAPFLLSAAAAVELVLLPPDLWVSRMMGSNSLVCLFYITMIGLPPLGVFVLALRHGAPTRPGLAGALAGVLAGGIAATFYAAQCTDDSPLFVATWYTIAVGGLALLGAAGARRMVRW